MNLLAACAFGLEAIVKRELIALGYDAHIVQPGRIRFQGGWADICRTNLWLRTADRVLIEVLQFPAPDFEALFETLKSHDLSEFLPPNAAFPVSGKSRHSTLTSVPAVQRATKKAIVESLLSSYPTTTVLAEDGPTYPVEIALLEDVATLCIDTTGPSLHKRGYRHPNAQQPLKETLAAAMVILSVWNENRVLVDPFCGSGTIPIEAAMIGMNIAPGLHRNYISSFWENMDQRLWDETKTEAKDSIRRDVRLQIIATDSDERELSIARVQADNADVGSQIHIQPKLFTDLRSKRQYGCVVTNPPCAIDEDHRPFENLYLSIPGVLQRLPTWSLYLLTNMPGFERMIGQRATRRRKLFNDRLECTYFQFLGPRPPRDYFSSPASSHVEQPPAATPDVTHTPVAYAAVQYTPAQYGPAHYAPVQYVPIQYAPPQIAPVQVESVQVTPVEVEPIQYVPVQYAPAQVAPVQVAPVQVAPVQVAPVQVASAQVASIEEKPVEEKPVLDRPVTAEPLLEPPVPAESDNTEAETQPQDAVADPTPSAEHNPPERFPLVRPQATAPIFGGAQEKDLEQAELFRSRLKKLARHLRRWPTKRGITCYRLYEKDIPEIPLVVDRYENNLHITEYERPHDRSLGRHAAWLELMKKTAAATLEIPIQNVFLKQRLKNRERSQYEKLGSSGNMLEVQESGLKFLVNLNDYVDTGLFLDHRNTRRTVGELADGADFLNLFAYTGSFSVYAAAGGARSTTTVDLSKNYLDWAERNFAINQLSGRQHRFVASDAMEFLQSARKNPRQRYDLAVVDPPTFSNSKRTEDDWDVQLQHAELLNRLHEIMKPAGVVYFSTNFRRFKLDDESITGYNIHEISKQSVPEDFRNRRIHRCWRLAVE